MCTIYYEEDKHRVAAYEGKRIVGECDYQPMDRTWLLNRVKVAEDYDANTANQIMQIVAFQARLKGAIVVPMCSYAISWFKKNRNSFGDIL